MHAQQPLKTYAVAGFGDVQQCPRLATASLPDQPNHMIPCGKLVVQVRSSRGQTKPVLRQCRNQECVVVIVARDGDAVPQVAQRLLLSLRRR